MHHPHIRSAVYCVALSLICTGATACNDRSVGGNTDAGAQHDAMLPDAFVIPDAAVPCSEPRLHMGWVWATHVTADEPEPDVLVYEVAGTALYLGPVTVPLATNPAFNREVQIEHADGQVSTVQYYLPPGVTLPVEQGAPYTFWLRNRQGFEGSAVGVVITRPTSGLPPLLFVADTGSYGRAFSPEDPAMSPLKVYVEPRPECPEIPDPACGGNVLQDQLRFDSSTGGAIVDVVVRQGDTVDLSLMGDPWRVTNLASTHVDQPCLDAPGFEVSYLAVNQAAVRPTCDTSRFWIWGQADAIDVGTYCDELYACSDSPAQQAAMQAASPDANCTEPMPQCGANALGCTWGFGVEVSQGLYDQLCAVSVLPDAPERIDCEVYFE